MTAALAGPADPSEVRYPGFEGRLVVVTGAGASGGQGAAEARLLANSGARVIAVDLASETPEQYRGTSIRYRTLDVSDEAGWARLADEIRQELGGDGLLKGLINNAGVTHRARLGQTELRDWDRVLAVNLTGPMLGMQALVPLMGEGSAIVNIGSAAAVTPHYTAAYTASKWGLRGLTHVAATEFGPRGIRANIVHPGFIETDMTANAPAAMRGAQLDLTPMERLGRAEHVAHAAVFLLSDAAAYISGAEVPVDGAFTSSSGVKYMADRIAAPE